MAPQTPAAGTTGYPESASKPGASLVDAASSTDTLDVRQTVSMEGADNTPSGPEAGQGATNAGAGVANQARPVPAAENEAEGVVLSDGRRATFRALKGRDAMKAHERAGGDGEKTNYVLAAMATKINGRPIVLEDLEDLPLADFFTIVNGYGEKNGQ